MQTGKTTLTLNINNDASSEDFLANFDHDITFYLPSVTKHDTREGIHQWGNSLVDIDVTLRDKPNTTGANVVVTVAIRVSYGRDYLADIAQPFADFLASEGYTIVGMGLV